MINLMDRDGLARSRRGDVTWDHGKLSSSLPMPEDLLASPEGVPWVGARVFFTKLN